MELPFILVEEPASLTEPERGALLFHDAPVPRHVPGLLDWMHTGACRALIYGTLPAIPVNEAPPEETLRRLWPAGILRHPGADLPALADYPFNGLFPHPMTSVSGSSAAIHS
jgi:hypothetical protein